MPQMTRYTPGSFCWADLATIDADEATSFYTGLFGWEPIELPTDAGVPYTMLLKNGRQVCALYPMGPDHAGVPSHWRSYVAVADAQATAVAVSARGGSVLMPPIDVMDAGRMAILQDPTGAVLGLWQPDRHPGAQLWNAPGAICWNELMTRDPGLAERFFAALFGWTATTSHSLMEGKYHILRNGDEQVGGMLRIEPEWGDMPSSWTLYFGVDDCDRAVAEARKRGGGLLFPVMEIENIGRFAYLQDPLGAVFAIIQQSHPS